MPPRRPENAYTLGYDVIAWIQKNCCYGPGDLQGKPAHLDPEMREFVIAAYAIDEEGRRTHDEAVLSRPKGRAKTELSGWLVVAEAFSDAVRFDHWGDDGYPVTRGVTSPLIKCLATEEGQAQGAFAVVAYIVSDWGQDERPDIYGGVTGARAYQSATALYIPSGGEIRACSSGAASKDGGKETFVVCDESHLYVLPELRRMYATIRRNLGKRRLAEPWMIQTTTAYRPGELSIAEETLTAWRKGELSPTVLVDHREAKGPIKIRDKDHTMKQLVYVYGDAAEWMDLERIYREMLDPRSCPDDATAARYFLNRPMATKDIWIPKDIHERQTRTGDEYVIAADEPICLGFDGSLNDDSTVLRGCRMTDGYLFKIGTWAKPEGAAGIGWEVPRLEVINAIHEAHARYKVVRGYYDPHEWQSDIETLAKQYDVVDRKGKVDPRVIPFYTRSDTRMGDALDRLHADLMNGVVFHDDDPIAAEHYGNAYVRWRGSHRLVRKEYPNSPRKIDSVVGDALAYEARADAIADGWDTPKSGLTRVKGRARGY